MTKRRQFGNVYQLRSGRWQARYRTDDGTFRNAPETFETKAKGGVWLAKEQADLDRGVWIDPNASKGITLAEYVERWLTQGRARRYQPRTLEFNTSLLRLYVLPTLGKLELAKIRRPDVARWYEAIATPGQAVKAYRLVRTVLNDAVADELIPFSPATLKGAGTQKTPERPKVTTEAIADIVERLNPRYSALVWAAALSGLREGELFALERRDVDILHREIKVTKAAQETAAGRLVGPPKSAAGTRTVAIPATLATVLDGHLAAYTGTLPTDLVFTSTAGAPLDRHLWAATWRRARRAAGHDELRFHDCRHLAGTLAAQSGATLKELMARLGHSTINAAMTYQFAAQERDRELADRMDAMLATRADVAQGVVKSLDGRTAGLSNKP
jgi:integrase